MKILHLTDFHFKSDSASIGLQDKVISSLVNSLSIEKNIDAIFFTGDLVYSGGSSTDFKLANEQFLNKILEVLNLKLDNLFICPGNHDVYRNQEMEAIRSYFETEIIDNSKLDDFTKDQTDKQFVESCRNLNNYTCFFNDLFNETIKQNADTVNELFTIHKRRFDDKTVAIVTINSAWRALDKNTKGKLLYPIAYIRQIISLTKDCDYRLLLMHHSLDDFSEFNNYELENEIYQGFLSMFSGHIHKRKQLLQITADEGILCCTSPATLSIDHDSKIGYSVVDITSETFEVKIDNIFYDRQEDIFVKEPSSHVQIPLSEVKKEQNDFRKTLRKKFDKEVEVANELFLAHNEYDESKTFLKLFSTPVIKTKSKSEINTTKGGNFKFDFEVLYNANENYLIFGRNKIGKTSLLKKLQLEWLKNFSSYKILPFYIDYSELIVKDGQTKIMNSMARYFELSQNKFEDKMKYYHVVLLIDNFEPDEDVLNNEIISFGKSCNNFHFIATTEEYVYRSFESYKFDDFRYIKLYLHEISRTDIRSLANIWPSIPENKKDSAIDKIIQIFDQLHIPYNYWTVSLFLWIFERNTETNLNSNIGLIELYIEGLLDRKRRILDKYSKIDYETLKSFLGELAVFLIKNHSEYIYSATFEQLVAFTADYRLRNRRFVIETKDIVTGIIQRGILTKKDEERYGFRLRGVFEYFIAYHMTQNKTYRDEIVLSNQTYLSYQNEFEIYAGLTKNDEIFLSNIFEKTKKAFDLVNTRYREMGSIDENLNSKVGQALDLLDPLQNKEIENHLPLTPELRDKLLDEVNPINYYSADVQKKQYYKDEIIITAEILEKFLSILSRVYKHSYLVKNESLTDSVFDYIIESSCNFGFAVMDEFEIADLEVDITEDDKKFIIKIFAHFMPLVVQAILIESLNQNNLQRIYQDKIDELQKDTQNNQFKLFLLYSLLIDLDINNNYKLFDKMTSEVKLPILKTSIVAKLHYYLHFKSYKRTELEKYLKNKIKDYPKRVTEIEGKRKVDKKLSEASRNILRQRSSGKK